MVPSRKNPSKIWSWYQQLREPVDWEAPDEKFIGHRNIILYSLARYQFVKPWLTGLCLEVGCGRGYGIGNISPQVPQVIGVDLSLKFLIEAKTQLYDSHFIQSNGLFLPFRSHTFDSVIAFEIIEHINDDLGFLKELKRMIRRDGIIAISTPNRLAVSGNSKEPIDRFHVREYSWLEFDELLRIVFNKVSIFGQKEKKTRKNRTNRIIDKIPVRLRSSFPARFGGLLSAYLRKPLNNDDFEFIDHDMDVPTNLIAICSN